MKTPYTIDDLHKTLNQYAGNTFGDSFFNNYIYKSGMPDYKTLFSAVGVVLKTKYLYSIFWGSGSY